MRYTFTSSLLVSNVLSGPYYQAHWIHVRPLAWIIITFHIHLEEAMLKFVSWNSLS